MKVIIGLIAVASVAMSDDFMGARDVRKGHHKKKQAAASTLVVKKQEPVEAAEPAGSAVDSTEGAVIDKMKELENKLEKKDEHHVANHVMMTGKLDVNGPLPADFNALEDCSQFSGYSHRGEVWASGFALFPTLQFYVKVISHRTNFSFSESL